MRGGAEQMFAGRIAGGRRREARVFGFDFGFAWEKNQNRTCLKKNLKTFIRNGKIHFYSKYDLYWC